MSTVEGNGKAVRQLSFEALLEEIGFGKFQMFFFVICGIATAADAVETVLLSFLSS